MMESHMQKSPNIAHADESSDAKYVSGLSTILVATIQETKDRISQIEYIFCSQLYPKFQLNSQSLQKIYSEVREAEEAAYKEKERGLLVQIEKLQFQNQQVMDENQMLKLEKSKFINMEIQSCNRLNELQEQLNQKTTEANEAREAHQNLQKLLESKSSLLHSYGKTTEKLEEKNTMLGEKQKKLEIDAEELQQELMKKSKEVDDMMEMQNKLLQVNLEKEIQLKQYEEKTNGLVFKLEKLENKVNELLSGLRDKTEEVEKGKELHGNLLKKIEFQASEIMNNEQILNKREKENTLLQEERKRLLDKQKGLEEKVDKLQQSLYERTRESSEGMELHGKLLQKIEARDSELLAEKRKRRELVTSYKNLKSQYTYLLKKSGLTQESIPSLDKIEYEHEIIRHNHTPVSSHDIENNKITEPVDHQEVLENKKGVVVVQKSPISPSTARTLIAPKLPSSSKSCPPAGVKRPSSYWRDTRSHQSRVGPDLHDDFLDTPLENVRGNLGKVMKEDRPDLPKPNTMNMSIDDSDDQTQDINADGGPQKMQKSPPKAGPSGFKYVEPVRKKSERENLKGVECKQCKKFYDAVLPVDGKNAETDRQNIRCEHHEGVSRHRYRYAPPSTPEGFWNIGFESEM